MRISEDVNHKPEVLVCRAIFPETLERLQAQFEVDHNQSDAVLTPADLAVRLHDKVGLMATGSEHVDAALLAAAPALRAVANVAVGYNNLDLAALTAAGVLATNTPDVLTETTADLAWALLLAAARRITEAERLLRAGRWQRWALDDGLLGVDVHGSTLGIVGMGRIGRAVARRAAGFDMQVLYHNRHRLPPEEETAAAAARYVALDTLLETADHILLVLPYTPESQHLIGAAELARMKRGATLVNIARGGIVDDVALAAALASGRLFAAGLDVFENEPRVDPALLAAPRAALTPHIGSATARTRRAMAERAADNLIAALGFGKDAGRPRDLLNPEALDHPRWARRRQP